MAERIGKYCWATPKCGITTAERHFKHLETDSKFKFIIVRNPYRRIASFYISKVIEHVQRDGLDNKLPHLTAHSIDCTFEELVSFIKLPTNERHLKLQSDSVEHIFSSKHPIQFVRCEYWPEDMKVVCEQLNIDYNKYSDVHENRSVTIDSITKYVGDKSPTWFIENGIPSDYSLFYNDATRKQVHTLYIEDFRWLSDVYDNFDINQH